MNFQILYGSGIKSLAESLGVPYEEGEDLYNRYMSVYSRIADYIQERSEFGREHGYVISKFGRLMRIWEYDSSKGWERDKADRMAVNCTIQSSATGDYPKIAMVRAKRAIKAAGLSDKIRLIMNIHDALEFYVHESLPVQYVIELLEPAVVFPVQGWPKMVADWHTWKRYGSPVEYKRGSDGIYRPEEKEIKSSNVAPPSVESSSKHTTLVLRVPHTVPEETWAAFLNLVQHNKGDRSVEVLFSNYQNSLKLKSKTSLGVEDSYSITRLLPGTVVEYKEETEEKATL